MRKLFYIIFRIFWGLLTTVAAANILAVVITVDDNLSSKTIYKFRNVLSFQEAVESRGGKVTWASTPRNYSVTWRAKRMDSGVYILRLTAVPAVGSGTLLVLQNKSDLIK